MKSFLAQSLPELQTAQLKTVASAMHRIRSKYQKGGVRSVIEYAIAAKRANDSSLRQHVATYNNYFFTELSVTRDSAERLHALLCDQIGIRPGKRQSIHLPAFAALQLSGFRPRNILELGTSLGETTAYVAELFPESVVYTVDLPAGDPIYAPRNTLDSSLLRTRLARSNIVALQQNTGFLDPNQLPQFELIWLDAGHKFPEVAWDHHLCLHKLSPGGWLFSDDVRFPKNQNAFRRGYSADVYSVLRYYNDRQQDQFRFLIKREIPERFAIDPEFVACLHKSRTLGNTY